MSRNTSSKGGLGVCSVVQIVFLILKLYHLIDWSWWWVLSPFFVYLGIVAVVLMLVLILKLT